MADRAGTKRRRAGGDDDDDRAARKQPAGAPAGAGRAGPSRRNGTSAAAADEDEEEDDEEDDEDEDEEDEDNDGVEITFEGDEDGGAGAVHGVLQPDAADLYGMAVEERADDNAEVAVKLFEQALEKFAEEDKAMDDKATKAYAQFALAWASCMSDFGEFYPLKDYLVQARTKFEGLQHQAGAPESFLAKAGLGLGRTELTLALMEHEEAVKLANEASADGQEDAVAPTSAELALYEHGVAHYTAATARLTSSTRRAEEMATMARYMASYGAVQSAGPHRTAVFRAAVEHAEAAAALAESNDFVLTVLGSAQHGLAEALGPDQPEEATALAQQSIRTFQLALHALDDPEEPPSDLLKGAAGTGCQLGDAYILHSTLLKDDERVLEAYETGVRFLQRAYERNPANAELYELLVQMGHADNLAPEPEDADDDRDGADGDEDDAGDVAEDGSDHRRRRDSDDHAA